MRLALLPTALCAALLALAPVAAQAAYTLHGSFNEGISYPAGIDVDRSSSNHDLYVANMGLGGLSGVNKFDETGARLMPPSPFGTSSDYLSGLAVDPTNGHIFAVDQNTEQIKGFDSSGAPLGAPFPISVAGSGQPSNLSYAAALAVQIATDAAGHIYFPNPVAGTVQELSTSTGAVLNTFSGGSVGAFSKPTGVAVDSQGNLYVADTGNGRIVRIAGSSGSTNPAGAQTVLTEGSSRSVAVDTSSGNVFVGKFNNEPPCGGTFCFHVVEFAPTGTEVEDFGAGTISSTLVEAFVGTTWGAHFNNIAVDPATQQLYVTDTGASKVWIFGPPTAPVIKSESASNLTQTAARLCATINPSGADTTYHFEYGETTSYGTSKPIPDADIGSGTTDQTVCVDIGNLEPGTGYHFRVLATNEKSPAAGTPGADRSFTTLKTAVDSEWATGVSDMAATLHAAINPEYAATTCAIEYGLDTSYGRSLPCSPAALGSGGSDVAASASIHGLEPNTTYHYRAVATTPTYAVQGADRTFTTQPAGSSSLLPDNRAYEQVSPQEKAGYNVVLEGLFNLASASSLGGERVSYETFGAFEGPSSGVMTENLAERGPNGWHSRSISPPIVCPCEPGLHGVEFEWFSPDLSLTSFWIPSSNVTEGSPPGYNNLYMRDNTANEYTLLTPVQPPNHTYRAKFGGASADLSHFLLDANWALTPDAPEPGHEDGDLYDFSGGALHFAGILPDGTPAQYGSWPGAAGGSGVQSAVLNARGAISSDGSRVFFTARQAKPGGGYYYHLYVRENPGAPETTQRDGQGNCIPDPVLACTVDVSASQRSVPDPNGPQDVQFMTASGDGSKVFFTSSQEFTNDANTGSADQGKDLYEYDLETGKLTDLTPDSEPGDPHGAEVQGQVTSGQSGFGLLGASEDGSHLYFAAQGVLTHEPNSQGLEAESGRPNVYLLHEETGAWKTKFVTTLESGEPDSFDYNLYSQIARVTPDGTHLLFQSIRSLTGYDNAPANPEACDTATPPQPSGTPCVELYLYDATANGGSGALSCVSCNPSGARPNGNTLFHAPRDHFSPQRFLSDDGRRVFFTSNAQLLPQDTNGTCPSNGDETVPCTDVYEWEAPGKGSCREGAPSYSARDGGCVYLISGGTGDSGAKLLDASASGNDVFFSTDQRLLPQDGDNLTDLYDARVGGGFPPPPASPQPCSGAACRGAAGQGPAGEPLGSLAFSGPGNLPAPVAKKPAARALTNAQKLARALKACKRKPKRQRARCQAQARKRYGPKKAHKSTSRRAAR